MKVIILDYSNTTVHIFPVPQDVEDAEAYIHLLREQKKIPTEGNMEWMTLTNEFTINFH